MATSFTGTLGKSHAVEGNDKKVHISHGQPGGKTVVPGVVVEAAVAVDALYLVIGVTADSTLWTADTHCVTADGRIVCVEAELLESAPSLDSLDAALGANVLFAAVAETADALDNLDAVVVAEIVSVPGGTYYRPPRPVPVYGVGYGILPQLEGEAHGVVGAVGKSAAQLLVRAAAIGASGQAGNATVVLKGLSVAGKGAVGTRGNGSGTIMKFSGSATGHHDDDEAAVIAFLLAA